MIRKVSFSNKFFIKKVKYIFLILILTFTFASIFFAYEVHENFYKKIDLNEMNMKIIKHINDEYRKESDKPHELKKIYIKDSTLFIFSPEKEKYQGGIIIYETQKEKSTKCLTIGINEEFIPKGCSAL